MNRKERRATLKRGNDRPRAAIERTPGETLAIANQLAAAWQHYRQLEYAQADSICRHVLARNPTHVDALNLQGLVAQASGEHNRAVKLFAKVIDAGHGSAVCHVSIATSYQALQRWDKATTHFTRAIALGLDDTSALQLVTQAPAIAGCLHRLETAWPRRLSHNELFGGSNITGVASQMLLQSMLKSTWICNWALENFLTHVRNFLLQLTVNRAPDFINVEDAELRLFCALAQQCFINEYVFEQTEEETRQAAALRDLLNEKLASGRDIPAPLLVAVAAYGPLHTLPKAEKLLQLTWREPINELLQQQLREPLDEIRDRATIPALTAIAEGVSSQVRQQYEENPFPRWIVTSPVRSSPPELGGGAAATAEIRNILVAGCGTGKHSIETAQRFPQARILAVDLSLSSLSYARRKTREAGIHNIDYVQADILKLGDINRIFDRIECGGVLHHLADPLAGWRVLLSLLRPQGIMFVGLYSEIARSAIVAGRALIAQQNFPATIEGIRACRQAIFRGTDIGLQKGLTTLRDFYSASGCRDLLFNIMEHRFTLPQIKVFLADEGLTFLGFDHNDEALQAFARRFPDPAARTDLDAWHQFETENPDTFIGMYQFQLRKIL